jgi:hypothetical protein
MILSHKVDGTLGGFEDGQQAAAGVYCATHKVQSGHPIGWMCGATADASCGLD